MAIKQYANIEDMQEFYNGIVAKIISDLADYYTKTEVNGIAAAIKNSRFEAVSSLPTTDIKTNVIYLVPKADAESGDIKDEYINLDGTTAGWERIGSTEIDLSNYVSVDDLNTALAAYTTTTDLTTLLAAKQDALTAGDGIDITNDTISIDPMPAADMDDVVDELPNGNRVAVTGYVPLGTIIQYYGETPPKFYLACDGSIYNKADYPELANHLLSLTDNTPYIVDGDNTKFKVPDLRGEFLRGTGTNSSTSVSGANVGVHQGATGIPALGRASSGDNYALYAMSDDNTVGANNVDYGSGASTRAVYFDKSRESTSSWTLNQKTRVCVRPTNTSVLFCIAYKDIYSNPMNDYSTDEKVVGTWVDGKTLYQKTIQITTPSTSSSTTIQLDITGASNGRIVNGYIQGDSSSYPIVAVNSNGETESATTLKLDCSSIWMRIGANSAFAEKPAYITIQYTKA